MKKKEDIAAIIKQKLNQLQATSAEPSWESVVGTLKRRKKRRLLFWWTGSVLSLLLIALFIGQFNNSESSSPVDTQTTEQTNTKGSNQNESPNNDVLKETTFTDDSIQQELDESQDNLDITSNPNSINKTNKTKQVSVTEFDSVDLMEGAEVKTTYYYYRDSDNTEVITKNKSVLDSLLNANNASYQTTERGHPKSKDSL
ncbi:MAG: hypothetical protein ABJM06_00505 [Gilvibacter sp.]